MSLKSSISQVAKCISCQLGIELFTGAVVALNPGGFSACLCSALAEKFEDFRGQSGGFSSLQDILELVLQVLRRWLTQDRNVPELAQ